MGKQIGKKLYAIIQSVKIKKIKLYTLSQWVNKLAKKKTPLPKDISKTIYPLNTGTYTSTGERVNPVVYSSKLAW